MGRFTPPYRPVLRGLPCFSLGLPNLTVAHIRILCDERDSNPHGVSPITPSKWRVYLISPPSHFLWEEVDSNHRRSPLQGDALPTGLPSHLERKTSLELATFGMASRRSTNWATSAFKSRFGPALFLRLIELPAVVDGEGLGISYAPLLNALFRDALVVTAATYVQLARVLRKLLFVGREGFEPPKATPPDLQSG